MATAPRPSVAATTRPPTSAEHLRVGPPERPVGPPLAARRARRGPAGAGPPTVTIMRQGVGRRATAKVHVGRVTTGPPMATVLHLAPRPVTRVAAPHLFVAGARDTPTPALPAVDTKGATHTVARPMLVTKAPLGVPPARVAAPGLPAAEPAYDRPLAPGDAITGLAPVRAPPGPDRKVLRPNPAVLGVPNEERDALPPGRRRVPWPTLAGAGNAGAVALAAAKAGRAVTVGPAAGVLGVGDGAPPVTYGEVRGGRHQARPLAALLGSQEERIAGPPPAVTGVGAPPGPPEVHQA